MLSHISKSTTVGCLLTGKTFGLLASLPGRLIDSIFSTLSSYDDHYATIATSYIGKVPGWVIGSILGFILGTIFYIPDSILRVLSNGYLSFRFHVNQVMSKLRVYDEGNEDDNYFQKSWSLGRTMFGIPLGLLTSSLGYIIDFTISIFGGDTKGDAANLMYAIGYAPAALIGGLLVGTIAFITYPFDGLFKTLANAYLSFRHKVSDAYAFAYAKTETTPDFFENDSEIDADWAHSDLFRKKVDLYNNLSYSTIFKRFMNPEIEDSEIEKTLGDNAIPHPFEHSTQNFKDITFKPYQEKMKFNIEFDKSTVVQMRNYGVFNTLKSKNISLTHEQRNYVDEFIHSNYINRLKL